VVEEDEGSEDGRERVRDGFAVVPTRVAAPSPGRTRARDHAARRVAREERAATSTRSFARQPRTWQRGRLCAPTTKDEALAMRPLRGDDSGIRTPGIGVAGNVIITIVATRVRRSKRIPCPCSWLRKLGAPRASHRRVQGHGSSTPHAERWMIQVRNRRGRPAVRTVPRGIARASAQARSS
jgi:hypothetical protein